jgi:hypothetical protein
MTEKSICLPWNCQEMDSTAYPGDSGAFSVPHCAVRPLEEELLITTSTVASSQEADRGDESVTKPSTAVAHNTLVTESRESTAQSWVRGTRAASRTSL